VENDATFAESTLISPVDESKSLPLDQHSNALRQWLADNNAVLSEHHHRPEGGVAASVEHDRGLLKLLYDAGWSRWGWPVQAGGLGGTARLRAVLYDELAAANIEVPEAFVLLETLGPVLTTYAPTLATKHLPRYLAGLELWGQGFSEPEAGSDLAAVATTARSTSRGYSISGQKVWTTLGQFAGYAAVLARTGGPDSGYRGLSMIWVDLSAHGVTVNPITAANGRDEFAEMFFDDVEVPRENLIGELNDGWAVAMYLLQFERGMYAWLRQAVLHRRLRDTVTSLARAQGATAPVCADIGRAYVALSALRARCGNTVRQLAEQENPGPAISVDKVLLSGAEHAVLDACRVARLPEMILSDEPSDRTLREDWFYSRATSIFGGAVEVQRDILADRVLRLPRKARDGRS
jgi:acyl-CoA dehydrogenase